MIFIYQNCKTVKSRIRIYRPIFDDLQQITRFTPLRFSGNSGCSRCLSGRCSLGLRAFSYRSIIFLVTQTVRYRHQLIREVITPTRMTLPLSSRYRYQPNWTSLDCSERRCDMRKILSQTTDIVSLIFGDGIYIKDQMNKWMILTTDELSSGSRTLRTIFQNYKECVTQNWHWSIKHLVWLRPNINWTK